MTIPIEKKCCQACAKPLKGRADKKFCNDYCRNNYNNQLKANSNNYIRNITNILYKNRRILAASLPDREHKVTLPKTKLLEQGFQFKYFTHTYTNQKGNVYCFCYDYGYLSLDNEWLLLVKRKQEFQE